MAASTTLNPEQRAERARKAALARDSIDRHIDKIVDAAPALTDEQAARLRALFAPLPGAVPSD